MASVYLLAEDEPERAASAIANLDLEYKPGARVVYSDLGFIALGILLSRLTGHSLADMARTEIFEPLGFQQTFFNPEEALQTGIAACETGNAYERDMCEQSGAGVYQNSRQRLIWGEVHDGNAYFLGGAAAAWTLLECVRHVQVGPTVPCRVDDNADAENLFTVSRQHDTGTRGVALARVATRGNE